MPVNSQTAPPELTGGPRQLVRSPEQVALELPIAGPTSRVFAFSIDFAIMALCEAVVAVAVIYLLVTLFDLGEWLGIGESGSFEFSAEIDQASGSQLFLLAQAVFGLAQFAIQWGYFVCFEMLMQGRSPGKAIAGLRVVRDGGLPLGFRESALRNLVRLVDMLPTAYLVGLVAMIASPDCKRLGDMAAGTIVVREDRPARAMPIDVGATGAAVFRFDRDQLRALGAAEVRLIRQTLRRLESLSEHRQAEVLGRATQVLCERIEYVEEVPPQSRRGFLVALLRASEEA